jgi:hypothetical protein
MTTAQRFARYALLIALLPQLLVLGLGRGVVLCIAPGGHLRVEAAASECCLDGGSGSAAVGLATLPADGADCGSCDDVRIAFDARVTRAASAPDHVPPHGAAMPAVAAPGRVVVHAGRALELRRAREGSGSPHLACLQNVVLRC